jgi:hypothetical protein
MVAANVDSVSDDEKLLPVPTAVESVTGFRPTPSTAWRWTKKGVAGGQKLKTAILGGRPVTTQKWVREFIAASTAAKAGR